MEVTPELVRLVGASQALCPHLHVPLQSGSDRILAAMGRPYSVAQFRERIARALDASPELCLGLDVMVGFPGEDEAAFAETRALLEAIPFAYLHVFPFSRRRGTPAYDMPNGVSDDKVKARARLLRELSRQKRQTFHAAHLGRMFRALPEGKANGDGLKVRTRNYIPIRVPWKGPAPADEVLVKLERLSGDLVIGRWVGEPAAGG
jgi:threonylcarbamoyladenosine tRNA methylthiotransferase MtaB